MRQFDRSLPMALLKAREAVMRKFTPHLREHGLSAQQWRVLRALVESGALDATEIAKRCALLMPSLSRILQNLERRDLIVRVAEQADLRRSLVSLTPAGIALFEKIAPQSEERYRHITEKFGYGKLELLYELLDELVEKLEDDAAA
ncbi:homoprotocatechuate degradation operon regulator HpaR [Haliea sp. E1-2-M8]|uniref:homoprotocatechuate degradation operon regulator HpaR n=1 Tax=Haliea sp. E1-2-M8 TaxID=3064706 RepID=UPI002728D829|nr:homoprotocatechuate degradation operon regulator HpaR [Haliea sp. E1-2-M8]MDO8863474.1 homoprotocatechuate degradation operon regulator HpaR [Haliea sp. E1-2-M8]